MAYIPTLPPLRESLKPSGGSPMSGIPVPAVPAVPQDLAMEKAERPEQTLERAALKPQQPRPVASACLAAYPRNVGPEEQRSEVVAHVKAGRAFPPMPKGIRVAGKNDSDGGSSSRTKDAPDEGFSNGDFGRPHPDHMAEIATSQESENKGAINLPVSAAIPIHSEPFGLKSEDKKQISLDFDDELTI